MPGEQVQVKLRECPFCPDGGDPTLCGKGERWRIECWKCKGRGGQYSGGDSTSPNEAVEFWNRRPLEDALKAELSKAQELLKEVFFTDGFLPEDFNDRAVAALGLVPCGNCGDDGEKPSNDCPKCKGSGLVLKRTAPQ